jgi:hypothetical protein
MPFRLRDQSVVADLPEFVSADANAFARAPGPVLVPVNVQWNAVAFGCGSSLSKVTIMSGNVVMNAWASLAIAVRPTAGGPLLMLIEPPSAKNAATLSGF